MASGWAPDGAVQDQIDDTIADALKRARAELRTGDAAEFCVDCGEEIPDKRRRAAPGVETCIDCQAAREADRVDVGINRRANKDSQLR